MSDLQTRICVLIAMENDNLPEDLLVSVYNLLTEYESRAIKWLNDKLKPEFIHVFENVEGCESLDISDVVHEITGYDFSDDAYSICHVTVTILNFSKENREVTIPWFIIEDD